MPELPAPGTRISLRYRLPAGSVPPLTDVIGHLLDTDPLVRVRTKERGRRATVMLAPDVTAEQRKAIKIFELDRWVPALLSSMPQSGPTPDVQPPE